MEMNDSNAMKQKPKNIALVAHDNKKKDLLEWVKFNEGTLKQHKLLATGTTGQLLEKELNIKIHKLQSGPLGGDLELGAAIAQRKIDVLIFFWDPLEAQPHDPDIKALLRISVVWNIPVACNRATADYIISSPLMNSVYEPILPNYSGYLNRLKNS
ncbi:MAG TPA: methylglyoxal synthase [Candidatus Marinimicrobia bacterium]|nr:methylglyoxal synthase [Candidatus Neomarinimicrobiota bacterium]HRS52632.1 methylglyoxal synthase [Candidatus Neomarinimicrobiota bacterium]HRU92094.1 methylglyoxal synthase [Candidatus Neomarinimicrobiota bacterium]